MKTLKRLLISSVLMCLVQPVLAEKEWADLEKQGGEPLFAEKCGMCHRENGMGTFLLGRRFSPELALLENRRDLQEAFVENVVRSGFRNMFPMSRGEVSDAQLKQIIEHLTRENGK